MSQWNTKARSADVLATTADWLKKTAPIVYVHGLSGSGKTRLLSSLFRHPLYASAAENRRVLYIDGEHGTTTIAEYVHHPQLCDLRAFDDQPEKQLAWYQQQLREARTVSCGAIVIEGLVNFRRGLQAGESAKTTRPDKMDLMKSFIVPTQRTSEIITLISQLQQSRRASRIGVPIIVTLNSCEQHVDPGDPSSPTVVVPEMSAKLVQRMMSSADALLELSRSSSGTRLLSLPDSSNPARKMRACTPYGDDDPKNPIPNAAELVNKQLNLDLPGLFALWADCDAAMTAKIQAMIARTTAPQEPKEPQT